MSRSLHNLTDEEHTGGMDFSHLTDEELEELLYLLEQDEKFKRYHKADDFSPYPYQQKFFSASKKHKRRFLMAANRIGKTFSAALELTYHLTGEYPEWWTGHKFSKPILAWAVGITGDSTRKVMQKELFGTISAKDINSIGSGSIPRDRIHFDTIERDGHKILNAKIKHISGDYSTLEFRSTQQGEHVLMGATVDYIWLDEEDAYKSEEIYSQCVTRTSTTGGLVTITATPENGETALTNLFMNDESGYLYLQNASWDDAPHLTPEVKEELLASIPKWQHDMRAKGLPLVGKGLVFPYNIIPFKDIQINNWDEVLWAFDRGVTTDETVLTLACKKATEDPNKPEYFIVEQWTLGDDKEGNNIRGPEFVADIITNHLYKNAPVIVPHDAGGKEGLGGFGDVLKKLGCNVQADSFYNPDNTSHTVVKVDSGHKISIEAGLWQMEQHFKWKRLFISETKCPMFLRETRSYVRMGVNKFKGADHHIDSARYAFMSLMANRGWRASECQTIDNSWDTGYKWED